MGILYFHLEDIIAVRCNANALLPVLLVEALTTAPASHALPGPHLPARTTGSRAGTPLGPGTPPYLLLSRPCVPSYWSLTAVILVMVVSSKLLTVVAATHKVSTASSVSIIETSISCSVTISLSLATRILWCAASPPVIVTASTALPCWRVKRNPWEEDRCWSLRNNRRCYVTAVILLMEVKTKLLAVIAATHKVPLTASMAIINTSIKRSITVSLS